MMRIIVNGVWVDVLVKKIIFLEFWSVVKGKVLEKKWEYKELNLYFDLICLWIMKIQCELEIEGVFVFVNSVLECFLGKDVFVQCILFEVFWEYNDKCV